MSLSFYEILGRGLILSANIFILYYVIDLEKKNCVCSETWIRDYIKIVSALMIVLNVLSLFLVNVRKKLHIWSKNNNFLKLLSVTLNIVLLGYLILVIKYYNKLNKDKTCVCSENWKRYALLYPLAIIAPFVFYVMYTIILYGSINISVKGQI